MRVAILITVVMTPIISAAAANLSLQEEGDYGESLQSSAIWPHESNLCGPIALHLACRSYGIKDYSVQNLAEMASFVGSGTSIKGLQDACDKAGLGSLAVRLDTKKLGSLLKTQSLRAIVLLDTGHFCYVDHVSEGKFRTTRFPFKPEWNSAEVLSKAWSGEALLVSRDQLSPSILQREKSIGPLIVKSLSVIALCAGLAYVLFLVRRVARKRTFTP